MHAAVLGTQKQIHNLIKETKAAPATGRRRSSGNRPQPVGAQGRGSTPIAADSGISQLPSPQIYFTVSVDRCGFDLIHLQLQPGSPSPPVAKNPLACD